MTTEHHHRYRRAILDALAELGEPTAAAGLHTHLHVHGLGIGLSTVYRELRTLAARNEVDELQASGQRLYRAHEDHLTHVFVCDECGRHEAVAADPRWAVLVGAHLDATKPLTIHGRCAASTGREANSTLCRAPGSNTTVRCRAQERQPSSSTPSARRSLSESRRAHTTGCTPSI